MFGFGKKEVKKDDTRELKAMLEGLESERSQLRREVEDLKSDKKIKEQEIKHLVKIHDEKREIEFKKKEIELEAKYSKDLAAVKDEFQDKQIEMFKEAKKDMEKVHSKILARLPNVNAKLSGSI